MPAKFQKDWLKSVGGVAHTRYVLSEGDAITEPQMLCPHFSPKRQGTKIRYHAFIRIHVAIKYKEYGV